MGKLGFGMLRLPQTDTSDWESSIDVKEVTSMADLFLAEGFRYFDTAYLYNDGFSEQAFREAVAKRYPRDAFLIADKLPAFKMERPEEMEPVFRKMLENCGVEYLDYFLLHAINVPNYERSQKINAFEFLQQKKAEGRAKNIGFSFHGTADVLDSILCAHPEVDMVQIQLNYLDWLDATIQSQKCYDVCVKHNKPVVVMEPIKGGSLINLPQEAEAMLRSKDPSASNASWALRFAASRENVMVVLSGMNNCAQVAENISFMKDVIPLTAEDEELLQKVADIIHAQTAIPCTGCRYCMPVCPQKIVISDYFAIYNTIKRFGLKTVTDVWNYYNGLIQTHGAPTDCIKCGSCEDRCPQNIPIRDWLETVHEELKDL